MIFVLYVAILFENDDDHHVINADLVIVQNLDSILHFDMMLFGQSMG